MKEYLTVEELIAEARRRGVDFGKGNPYNRLRYYTKIGWIPHMTRMKLDDGSTKGHYPKETIERLLEIQKYKDQNISNDEISTKLHTKDRTSHFYTVLMSEDVRRKIMLYAAFIMIILIFLAELGVIKVGKQKIGQIIIQDTQGEINNTLINDTGTAYVPVGNSEIFITSEHVYETSRIYITFKSDFSPATRFWVDGKIPNKGFTLKLDSPVLQDSEFDWWISN